MLDVALLSFHSSALKLGLKKVRSRSPTKKNHFHHDINQSLVYAIDASDIADQAKRIVAHNGMSHVIEVIKGRVEEIELPEKVDVIVSEWMGYFLLYISLIYSVIISFYACLISLTNTNESMFESVILARDKFLKPVCNPFWILHIS